MQPQRCSRGNRSPPVAPPPLAARSDTGDGWTGALATAAWSGSRPTGPRPRATGHGRSGCPLALWPVGSAASLRTGDGEGALRVAGEQQGRRRPRRHVRGAAGAPSPPTGILPPPVPLTAAPDGRRTVGHRMTGQRHGPNPSRMLLCGPYGPRLCVGSGALMGGGRGVPARPPVCHRRSGSCGSGGRGSGWRRRRPGGRRSPSTSAASCPGHPAAAPGGKGGGAVSGVIPPGGVPRGIAGRSSPTQSRRESHSPGGEGMGVARGVKGGEFPFVASQAKRRGGGGVPPGGDGADQGGERGEGEGPLEGGGEGGHPPPGQPPPAPPSSVG